MDINQCKEFVLNVANKTQQGSISPEQFNNFAPIAQVSVINQMLGNEQEYQEGFRGGQNHPVPRYGLGTSQKISEDLRPIITKLDLTLSGDRTAAYPSDSLYLYSVHQFDGTTDGAEIIGVQPDEAHYLQRSVIKPPILGRGIYYVIGGLIYFKPLTLTGIALIYVKNPATPVWGFSYVNSVPVYDAGSSQDFQVGPLLHLRICAKILQMCGINLSLDLVTAYGAAMEASGA